MVAMPMVAQQPRTEHVIYKASMGMSNGSNMFGRRGWSIEAALVVDVVVVLVCVSVVWVVVNEVLVDVTVV